jgi:hypothetical protein
MFVLFIGKIAFFNANISEWDTRVSPCGILQQLLTCLLCGTGDGVQPAPRNLEHRPVTAMLAMIVVAKVLNTG